MTDLAILLAPGFEEFEAMALATICVRGGLTVDLVSTKEEEYVIGSHGFQIWANKKINEVVPQDYRAVVLPGGVGGMESMCADEGVLEFLRLAEQAGLMTAAVCAAPVVLGKAGLLEGKVGTCYPGFEGLAGFATTPDELVVRDGRIITSRGPATAQFLGLKLVQELAGDDKRREVYDQMLYPLVKAQQQKGKIVFDKD